MLLRDLSVCFHTERIAECRDFYVRLFGAVITFECDWYLSLRLAGEQCPYFLCFMTPRHDHVVLYNEGGVTLNLEVPNVDDEYARLKDMGADILIDIADDPWGSRSFSLLDPIGNILYIYTATPVSDEYADAVKA